MVRLFVAFLSSILYLSGCAKIVIAPVDPSSGSISTSQDKGLRYYLPKPYLLVAEAYATVSNTKKETGNTKKETVNSASDGKDQNAPKDQNAIKSCQRYFL
jgi:hypothetical protein